MATSLQKAKCVLWFNKTKCVKQGQRLYVTECGVKQLSEPSIFAFKKFSEKFAGVYKILFATECMDGTGIPT
jgi:hypothetical protein